MYFTIKEIRTWPMIFDAHVLPSNKVSVRITIDPSACVSPRATIGVGVHIGPRVCIDDFARIEEYASISNDAVVGRYAIVGSGSNIRTNASVPAYSQLGRLTIVGPESRFVADLGVTDHHRKTLCAIADVAYIGAGCRWFTLAKALKHWSDHSDDRRATMLQMKYARELAKLHNLRES